MIEDLQSLLSRLEVDSSLFEPRRLRKRIEAMDELDRRLGVSFEEVFAPKPEGSGTIERAATMRRRLDAADAEVYRSIRWDICQTGKPGSLRGWIELCIDEDDPMPGLGYDVLDEMIAGVLQIPEPGGIIAPPGPEQVFYQPTPMRHLLALIEGSGLSSDDVLVDFGSGLGQLCIVAAILKGSRAIGIELETAYVESARQCAQNLGLNRVEFVHADAREADLSPGTVFHLYTPFTGSILKTMLNRLQEESRKRPIRVCTLGPCTAVVAQESWLKTDMQPIADQVTIFLSRD